MRVLPVVLALARQAWQCVAQILGYVTLQGAVMAKYQIMGRPLAGSFFAECLPVSYTHLTLPTRTLV